MIAAGDSLEKRCDRCGKQLTAREAESGLCRECAIMSAQDQIAPEPESLAGDSGNAAHTRRSALLVAALSVALLVVGLWMLPPVLRRPAPEPPPRLGVLETDEAGDECIENLDILLGHLQETGEFDDDIVCPVSGEAYALETTEDGVPTKVSCPNPELHELTAIYVEATESMPVAVEGGEQ